ncbi:YbfB/YjiJ family MFS transporter [Variibacter gotjawalensis]|nr:YbfB/YjiJ family MFS transporter [Variibacter gotjawalensis]NIK48281.1 MFS family permease [Variibacter gotjawalensis]
MAPPSENPINPLLVAIGGAVAMATYMGLGRFVYTPILPVMVEHLGYSKGQVGVIASSNFLGYLTGVLIGATPWIKGSRRAWALAMLALSAVTTGALAFFSSILVLSVLRFVGGVASAIGFVFLAALVIDRLTQAGRVGLLSVQFAGVGIGIASSAFMVSVMIRCGAGPYGLWLACGAAGLVSILLVALLIPARTDTPVAAAASGSRGGMINSAIIRIFLAYSLYGFGYVITVTFLVAIVRANPAIQPLEFWIWIIVGLAAAPSIALWNRIARKLGPKRTYALACVAEAIGVASSVLWQEPAGAILAAVLLGGTFVALTPLGIAAAREHAAGDPRIIISGISVGFGIGQIIGPIFAGWLFDSIGSFMPSTLAAAGALLVAAGLMLSIRPARV